jgi:hypothetical protein
MVKTPLELINSLGIKDKAFRFSSGSVEYQSSHFKVSSESSLFILVTPLNSIGSSLKEDSSLGESDALEFIFAESVSAAGKLMFELTQPIRRTAVAKVSSKDIRCIRLSPLSQIIFAIISGKARKKMKIYLIFEKILRIKRKILGKDFDFSFS